MPKKKYKLLLIPPGQNQNSRTDYVKNESN